MQQNLAGAHLSLCDGCYGLVWELWAVFLRKAVPWLLCWSNSRVFFLVLCWEHTSFISTTFIILSLLLCHYWFYFTNTISLSVKGRFCPGPVEECSANRCQTSFSSTLCSAPWHPARWLTGSNSKAVRTKKEHTKPTKEHVKYGVRQFPAASQTKVESMNEIKQLTSHKLQQKMLC